MGASTTLLVQISPFSARRYQTNIQSLNEMRTHPKMTLICECQAILLCMNRPRRLSFKSIVSIFYIMNRVLTIVMHSSAACARRIAIASNHKNWRSIHIRSKLNSNTCTSDLNKMENCTYFFVEHDITDKQGWDKWSTSWYDIFGESMIIRNIENENYRLILPSTNAFDIPLLYNK